MRVRSMTGLQKLISHTSAVNAIIAHLQEVLSQYGPNGLGLMMDLNVDEANYPRLGKIGLESVEFGFPEVNAGKILKYFHQGMESEEAREAFAEIAEIFNSDLRFNQMMQHYHAMYPDKSEQLRNFLLAEASCCILETCMTTNNKKLFAKWRSLQTDNQSSDEIHDEQTDLKLTIERGILLLGNVRKAVADYRHPEQQAKKKKVSLTSKKIDPMSTDKASQEILAALLLSHPDVVFFDVTDPVTGKPVKYLVPDPEKHNTLRYVKLTQPLVRYRRKKSAEDRFAVCHTAPLGQGAYGVVYESSASLSIKPGKDGGFARAVAKKKSQAKTRVIKEFSKSRAEKHESVKKGYIDVEDLYHPENIKREGEILEKILLLHTKPGILAKDQERGALVMRKFKGKELILHLMADWGDDHEVITKNTFTLDQRLALTIMAGEAIINQVHASGVIHRDIKGDNIMVELDAKNNPLSAVVIDYGLAKYKGEITPEHVGTPGDIDYRAPEVIDEDQPSSDEKSDAYSFAMLLKEIIWYDVMYGKRYQDLGHNQKKAINDVMKRGTTANPANRASLQDIVNVFKEIQQQRSLSSRHSY